jgi:hypothetical protein
MGMGSFPGYNFNSISLDDSINSSLVLAFAQTNDDDNDIEDKTVDEDIELQGTILTVNDDGSFDLETADGVQTILADGSTIIDDGLELSDIIGFVVDIDAVDVDGSLLATEIEFDDETDENTDETEKEIEIEVEIEDGVAKIKVEINDEESKFEIEWVDEQTTIDEIALRTDLTVDQISSVISFEIELEDDEVNDAKQSKKDEKLAKAQEKKDKKIAEAEEKRDTKQAEAQEKRDKKIAKAEEKRAEKIEKTADKLAKAQIRLTEKLTELEIKLTEKAQLSEERANKILEKIVKETQKHNDRVQKLLDKYQSGKYFGDITNTDKEIKSFTLTFGGTAAEIGDKSIIETLSGELFLENQLTGSHSKKFRVTGGEIFVGDSEVFDVIFGKARLSSSGQGGEKDSMIIIAQTSDGVDVRTLKLSIDLSEEFTSETESAKIEILFPQSKIASLWFLSATGNLGLTESIPDDTPPVDDTTPDDTTPDDTTPDDTPPADIPETIVLTVSTEQDSYVSGNEIVITGTVGEIIVDLPVVLQIVTATDLIEIAQIIPESDGTFTHTILADGPQWLTSGTVTVKAFYGGNNVAETGIEFTV